MVAPVVGKRDGSWWWGVGECPAVLSAAFVLPYTATNYHATQYRYGSRVACFNQSDTSSGLLKTPRRDTFDCVLVYGSNLALIWETLGEIFRENIKGLSNIEFYVGPLGLDHQNCNFL